MGERETRMAQPVRHSIQARRLAQVKRTLLPPTPQAQALAAPQNNATTWRSAATSSSSSSDSGASKMTSAKKARILCLHGYENSASILKKQLAMAHWFKHLENTCEFVFLSGPFDSVPPVTPIVQQYFPDDPKCQWFEKIEHVEAGVRYIGLDKGLQHIQDAFDKQGPFDGLLGFSQGAGVSLLVAAKQQHGELLQNHPPLKFAILIAGFRPRDFTLQHVFESRLKVPTCHIWGHQDPLCFKSEEATKMCASPLVLQHKAGHKVPNIKTIDEQQFRAF